MPNNSRAPRLRLLLDGSPVAGAIEARVESNDHYAADRFAALVAATDPGADPRAAEIQMSLDGGITFTSLVEGLIDRMELDPLAGTLWLEGRDRTRLLIEARTSETFANRTASDIAALLAARHDLAADVAATTTLVGRYWHRDHDRTTLDQWSRSVTEWDLLSRLAGLEGFDLWVEGRTLHFRPPAMDAPALPVSATAFTRLGVARQFTLSRAVVVTVKSWNAREQRAFTASARSGEGAAQNYVYVEPNLTPAAADALARRKLAELARHRVVLEGEMPGELTLAPRRMLAFTDLPGSFGGRYRVSEVERELSATGGFRQRIRAFGDE